MRGFWIIVVLLLAASPPSLAQQASRIICENPVGSRVQWVDNAIGPASQNRQLVRAEDAITGAQIEITFLPSSSDAIMVVTGNANTGGRVTTTKLIKFSRNDYLSFVGVDEEDGSSYLLTYFPKLQRLLWTMHNDRIFFVDNAALAKTFMMTCSSGL